MRRELRRTLGLTTVLPEAKCELTRQKIRQIIQITGKRSSENETPEEGKRFMIVILGAEESNDFEEKNLVLPRIVEGIFLVSAAITRLEEEPIILPMVRLTNSDCRRLSINLPASMLQIILYSILDGVGPLLLLRKDSL
eukprot:scaffold3398_cov186-Chaetoceros_neogracile.AAC.1